MMKIVVRVKPNAREAKIEKAADIFIVYVPAPPQDNKANKAVIKLLAEYFQTAPSHIRILRGAKSKQKLIEIA